MRVQYYSYAIMKSLRAQIDTRRNERANKNSLIVISI